MTERSRSERNVCHLSQASTLIIERWRNSPAVPRPRYGELFRTWRYTAGRAVACLPACLLACLPTCLPSHSWMHFHVITGSPRCPCVQLWTSSEQGRLSLISPWLSLSILSSPVFIHVFPFSSESLFSKLMILLASF